MTASPAAPPRTLPRFAAPGFLLILWLLLLPGCGYTLGGDNSGVLARGPADELPTLKIKEVENPTLFPWLNHLVRSYLRDEVNARNMARWVDSGRTDYAVSIKMNHYTYRSWAYDAQDATMLYEADIILDATIYKGSTNETVWQSGPMSYSQSYETVTEKLAAQEILRTLIRQLVDRMRQEF
jgi:MarR-like DNA-binding transcriptional regulator SgrR of sgrS sRNA